MKNSPIILVIAAVSSLYLAGCNKSHTAAAGSPPPSIKIFAAAVQHMPALISPHALRVDHVTIVIMENRSFADIIGNSRAPYINGLANANALFTNSYAVSHPSQPNYLAIYSGSTQGVTSDVCPVNFPGPSLGGELMRAHKTIRGYMEDLPAVGSTVCAHADYWRKHNPLVDFSDTPLQSSVPYSQSSSDIASDAYPTVAFIVPNQLHDMHDGTIAMADAWLAANLPPILAYDATHKGLLFLTWDEDDYGAANHIATMAVGPMITPGRYNQKINHYSVLRTITDLVGLPALNNAAPIGGPLR